MASKFPGWIVMIVGLKKPKVLRLVSTMQRLCTCFALNSSVWRPGCARAKNFFLRVLLCSKLNQLNSASLSTFARCIDKKNVSSAIAVTHWCSFSFENCVYVGEDDLYVWRNEQPLELVDSLHVNVLAYLYAIKVKMGLTPSVKISCLSVVISENNSTKSVFLFSAWCGLHLSSREALWSRGSHKTDCLSIRKVHRTNIPCGTSISARRSLWLSRAPPEPRQKTRGAIQCVHRYHTGYPGPDTCTRATRSTRTWFRIRHPGLRRASASGHSPGRNSCWLRSKWSPLYKTSLLGFAIPLRRRWIALLQDLDMELHCSEDTLDLREPASDTFHDFNCERDAQASRRRESKIDSGRMALCKSEVVCVCHGPGESGCREARCWRQHWACVTRVATSSDCCWLRRATAGFQ